MFLIEKIAKVIENPLEANYERLRLFCLFLICYRLEKHLYSEQKNINSTLSQIKNNVKTD